MKRVVVTGMGGITALGDSWAEIEPKLRAGQGATQVMPEWEQYQGLMTRLAAPVTHFKIPEHYPRKRRRSMGRVALMSTRATEEALTTAGLIGDPEISNGSMGIAYGSCTGSPEATADFVSMLTEKTTKGITATSYVEMMTHTCAVNTGLFFGLKGRVIPTSSACTSGSQGIGYAYEAIRFGRQTMMIGGGAEELCPAIAAVFDTLFATSQYNDRPHLSPRPFDKDRDGLVIGEGACTFVLEELEHALARGAKIYAEIVGFATNSDGVHITQPTAATIEVVMRKAIADANMHPDQIGYVSAHGTATDQGDIAETVATESVFGSRMPISSLKSYYGHTLGACGSMESWLTIEMMNNNWFAPTIHLENIDPRCGQLDYITGGGRNLNCEYVMSNNFAFGGINTSLIFKRWVE